MGLMEKLALRLVRRMGGPRGGAADVASRVNIAASAIDEDLRDETMPPPPVAGWRYVRGTWLRWSELEDEYRPAPIPYSLVSYTTSIGTPRDGLAVAMIDGEWREVPSGAAPLRGHVGAQGSTGTHPGSDPPGSAPPDPSSAAGRPVPAEVPAPMPDPARQRAEAEAAMKDQLAAWRRRNRS